MVVNPPSLVDDDEEAVKNSEGKRRHGEEIHGGYRFAVVFEERHPALCRFGISRNFPRPAQHSSFRNVEAQHLQLAVDSRCFPGPVLGNHAKDEFLQFPADAFSSCAVPMPRKPRPKQLESSPVRATDSLRLDEDQCPFPSRPEPPQHHPEQFVRSKNPRLRMPPLQNRKLLPKGQVFQEQVMARTEESNSKCSQKSQQAQHEISFTCTQGKVNSPLICMIRRQIAVLASHSRENPKAHRPCLDRCPEFPHSDQGRPWYRGGKVFEGMSDPLSARFGRVDLSDRRYASGTPPAVFGASFRLTNYV